MAQWFDSIAGTMCVSCPISSTTVKLRDRYGIHMAVAMARIIKTSGHPGPDHERVPHAAGFTHTPQGKENDRHKRGAPTLRKLQN